MFDASELKPLVTEKDLEGYESYLNSITADKASSKAACWPENLIGSYVFLRIIAGNSIFAYEGMITNADENFISLKQKGKKLSVFLRTENIVTVSVLK